MHVLIPVYQLHMHYTISLEFIFEISFIHTRTFLPLSVANQKFLNLEGDVLKGWGWGMGTLLKTPVVPG